MLYHFTMSKKKEAVEEPLPKKEEAQKEPKEHKEPVKAYFSKERVLTESSDNGREFYNQSRYGELLDDGKVQLSLTEALYLLEKKRLIVHDSRNKLIDFETLLKKAQKSEPNCWIRYCVYRDI